MFAIEVEFLTGRYVATAFNDRGRAEWPPHPSRLFSAFVATWAEGNRAVEEADALRWLEAQPAPTIVASDAAARSVATNYVPVNDLQTVSEPARERARLEEAEAKLASTDSGDRKALDKAQAMVEKAQAQLVAATKKATGPGQKITTAGVAAAMAVLPESRMRQPRTFPSVTPEDARVVFVWPEEPPLEVSDRLGHLCTRLVRLGHSSSFVRASVRSLDRPPSNGRLFVPDETGTETIRVPQVGQFDQLEREWQRHCGVELRVLPRNDARYRIDSEGAEDRVARSCFGDDWIVFERTGGDRIPMVRTVDLATAIRGGLLNYAESPAPALITGHEVRGGKLERPHLSFLPLPYVASAYANGDILGVALVLPRAATEQERRSVLQCVGRWEDNAKHEPGEPTPQLKLTLGRHGKLHIQRIAFGLSDRSTLRPRTWCGPSPIWATATPIALDRNPGDLHASDPTKRAAAYAAAEDTVAIACTHIGLPRPAHVDVVRSAVLAGTPKPRSFPPFPRDRSRYRRVLVHARLVFNMDVWGPLLIGAGRYFGLGLCRPLRAEGAS